MPNSNHSITIGIRLSSTHILFIKQLEQQPADKVWHTGGLSTALAHFRSGPGAGSAAAMAQNMAELPGAGATAIACMERPPPASPKRAYATIVVSVATMHTTSSTDDAEMEVTESTRFAP